MPTPEQLERLAFTEVKEGSPLHALVAEHRQKPVPDSRDWWQEVAQGLGVRAFDLKAQRDEILEALKAARDLLVGCQKHAGYIPGQGYSATLTEYEMTLVRGIKSMDAIIGEAEGK